MIKLLQAMHRIPPVFFLFCLWIAASSLLHAETWENHPRLGNCFADPKAFIQAEFGPSGTQDENIVVSQAVPLTDGSVWVVDRTAMTNFQWYLLQPGRGALCLTAFIPNAVQSELRQEKDGLALMARTQAAPGFPEKAVTFRRLQGEASFKATSCREVLRAPSGKETIRQVSCPKIFEFSFDPLSKASASHVEANVPIAKEFEAILKRDIGAYMDDGEDSGFSISVELLRQGPTQVGVALPKYYVWIEKRDPSGALVEAAAARVAAVERDRFEVIQYFKKERILAEPALIQKVFPKDVYEKIVKKASGG